MSPSTRIAAAFVAVVLLASAIIAGFAWQVRATRQAATSAKKAAAKGEEAHSAICYLLVDLSGRISAEQRSITSGQDFLDQNPTGITLGGLRFTAAQIQASLSDRTKTLDNQRATFKSLDTSTTCDPPTPKPVAKSQP